jgi:putative ABC transport system permease protein
MSTSASVATGDLSYTATVVGTTPDYAIVRNLELSEGRFFDQDEYDGKSRVVVLGSGVVEEIFPYSDPLGSTVRIGSRTYEVVGVLAEQDSGTGGSANEQVYLPLSTGYRTLFTSRGVVGTEYQVSSIQISAEDPDQVSLIVAEITDLLRARHALDLEDDDDFMITNQQDLLESLSEVSGTLTVLLAAIASVSLLVGGIGIMNISLVSVTERTKEIGLRKALGARRFQILQQFLIETVVLSTLGGVIGVLAGVGVALLVNNSGALNAVVAPESILLGLGFSVAVGVFFGVYPANRAASLHPIEALRYE